jgi:hypothetical protein
VVWCVMMVQEDVFWGMKESKPDFPYRVRTSTWLALRGYHKKKPLRVTVTSARSNSILLTK